MTSRRRKNHKPEQIVAKLRDATTPPIATFSDGDWGLTSNRR